MNLEIVIDWVCCTYYCLIRFIHDDCNNPFSLFGLEMLSKKENIPSNPIINLLLVCISCMIIICQILLVLIGLIQCRRRQHRKQQQEQWDTTTDHQNQDPDINLFRLPILWLYIRRFEIVSIILS